jgi:ribose-phosphate pyrophosphokinase
MKVISTEPSQILGARVASGLGTEVVDVRFSRFPDGEHYMQAGAVDEEMVIVGSVNTSDALVQLLLLIDACEGSDNTLVLPYMGYARQDKRFHPGEPLSARAVAQALSHGVSRVFTVNIHEESVLSHFRVPARNVSLAPDIGRHLRDMGLDLPVILAPDEGACHFAGSVASVCRWEWDHLKKTRLSGEEVRIEPKRLGVSGRDVVIVDDIISTGGTIATAASMLRQQGARRVYAACVHGVFTGGAFMHLIGAGVQEIFCTDTIERGCSQVSGGKTIAETILAC